MGDRVAGVLHKYWDRAEGTRRFRNGMSLGEVAAEMDEETSTLSRVLRGERNFTRRQLEGFIRVIDLSAYEAWELREALVADRMGGELPIPWESGPDGLVLIHKMVETGRGLGRSGQPQEALGLLRYLGESVDRQLGHRLDAGIRRDLLRERAEIHIGVAYCLEYITGGMEIRRIGAPEYSGIERLSAELGDTGLIVRLRIHQAVGAYIGGEFEEAARILEEVRARDDIPGDAHRLFANRTLMLSLAYMFQTSGGDRRGSPWASDEASPYQARVREIDAETQSLLARNTLSDERHVAMYLEGQARAIGLLGDVGQAFKLLIEGKALLKRREERLGRLPIVWAQYGRTWVELLSSATREDDSYMTEWAQETVRAARGRYPRYIWLVEESLRRAAETRGPGLRKGKQTSPDKSKTERWPEMEIDDRSPRRHATGSRRAPPTNRPS